MSRNLVVVESPAKAKTIAHYLGAGYTVKASVGHVRDLPPDALGVDVILAEGVERQGVGLAVMNRLMKAASHNVVRV